MQKPPVIFNRPAGSGVARCRQCFYVIEGLESSACPECGLRFDPSDSKTFTLRPPFLGWVFWAPGLVLSIVCGVGITAALMLAGIGAWSLWFGVPAASGAILGYRVRVRWFLLPILILTVIICVPFALFTMNLTGLFCGLTIAAAMFGPLVVGTLLGAALRLILKATGFSQRSYLPVFALMLLPVATALLEGRPGALQPEVVRTTRVVAAAPDELWDNLMFYENVPAEKPLLLRLGLPAPIRAEGPITSVGDVTRCLYNKGSITKQVTAIAPGKALAFDVTHQDVHFEHDVRLISGSFEFDPIAPGRTRITLVTTYQPLVSPRFWWRPLETIALHTLHDHVIDGIAAAASTDPRRARSSPNEGNANDAADRD